MVKKRKEREVAAISRSKKQRFDEEEQQHYYDGSAAAAAENQTASFKVLVRGLPKGATSAEMEKILSSCGSITNVKIKEHDDSNFAIVDFAEKAGATQACSMSDSLELRGSVLKISLPKGGFGATTVKPHYSAKTRPSVGVLVDRLPANTTEEDIRIALRECGAIVNVELKRGGLSAHVNFVSILGAEKAIEKGVTLKGTTLPVRLRSQQSLDLKPVFITLHLTNMHDKTGEAEVRQALDACGRICNVRIAKNQAFVDVETKTAAKKALKMSPVRIRGKPVKIEMSKVKKLTNTTGNNAAATNEEEQAQSHGKSDTTVFVKNLPYDIEDHQVKRIFKSCGTITGYRPFLDRTTKAFKGMAYIDFENADQVEKAVALSGSDVQGRPIVVDYTLNKRDALAAIGKEIGHHNFARNNKRKY